MLCLALSLALPPSLVSGGDHATRARYEPRTFLGYACDDDCQRHKDGFRWAERHAVTDSAQCAQLSRAEAEGCAAYLDDGRGAEAAGETWANENEIVYHSDCLGAGERFFVGCIRQLPVLINTY